MNKSQILRKAFFDSLDAQSSIFWSQTNPKFFSNLPKILEDPFYTKYEECPTQWQTCTLFLYGHYLVYKNPKNSEKVLNYLNLEENYYRVEVIQVVKKKGGRKNLIGFSIVRDGNRAEFLCKKDSSFAIWRANLSKCCTMTNFYDEYRILSTLGSGGYGKVFLVEKIGSKAKWAAKFIKMNQLKNREKQQVMVKNEIKALKGVDHPGIIKLHEVYEMDDEVCLVTEYVKGERLFDEIVRSRGLTERNTAIVIKQIFSILNYLEFKDMIHRDIKPENILFTRNDKDQMVLKLIDFGLATYHTKRDAIKKGGTAGYVAPEVLNNEPYDFKVDLYSTGVIMYTCLTGKPLFYALNYNDLLEKNKKGIVKFGGKAWNKVSDKARDLLQTILEPDPSRRISITMALEHPWLAAELTEPERQDLLENAISCGKFEVPKEEPISKLPESLGQISPSNKAHSHTELTSHHSISSTAWGTSRYAAESGNVALNSFYKYQTKDSNTASQNDVDDQKTNVLFLPNLKNFPPQKSQTNQSSLSMSNQEIGEYRFGVGYNIQIHVINNLSETDFIPNDEEDNPCSHKYAELPKQELFFENLNFKRPESNTRVA